MSQEILNILGSLLADVYACLRHGANRQRVDRLRRRARAQGLEPISSKVTEPALGHLAAA
jgi:hypothetical protein